MARGDPEYFRSETEFILDDPRYDRMPAICIKVFWWLWARCVRERREILPIQWSPTEIARRIHGARTKDIHTTITLLSEWTPTALGGQLPDGRIYLCGVRDKNPKLRGWRDLYGEHIHPIRGVSESEREISPHIPPEGGSSASTRIPASRGGEVRLSDDLQEPEELIYQKWEEIRNANGMLTARDRKTMLGAKKLAGMLDPEDLAPGSSGLKKLTGAMKRMLADKKWGTESLNALAGNLSRFLPPKAATPGAAPKIAQGQCGECGSHTSAILSAGETSASVVCPNPNCKALVTVVAIGEGFIDTARAE